MNNQTTQSLIPPRSRDKAIESANNCAFLWAMAVLEKDENLRNPDYLARYFINTRFRTILETMPLESLKQFVENMFPTSYHHLIARTKHVDMILNRAVKEGVRQVVILGPAMTAGLIDFKSNWRESGYTSLISRVPRRKRR